MPISALFGNPRQGKSYTAVKRYIVPALKAGRTVITNIPLTDSCGSLPGKVIQFTRGSVDIEAIADMLLGDKDSSGEYIPKPETSGGLFVLDEFFFYCPAGTKPNKYTDKVKAFFAMHGHTNNGVYATEILILAQNAGQVCSLVKDMVQQSYRVSKVEIGNKSYMNIDIYRGCAGVRSGDNKGLLTLAERETFDEEFFQYYKTQTMSTGLGSEAKTDDATNGLRLPAIKWLALSALFIPFALWFAVSSFMSLMPAAKTETESEPVSGGSSAPSLARQEQGTRGSVSESVSVSVLQDLWAGVDIHLLGFIKSGDEVTRYYRVSKPDGSVVMLSSDDLRVLGLKVSQVGMVSVIDRTYDKELSFPPPPVSSNTRQKVNFDILNLDSK